MKTTSPNVLGMLPDLPALRRAVEFAALMAAYRLLRLDLRNLGIGRIQIGAKANKVDSKFSMIKTT